jgi:peptidoglycan lytic transglycosylase
MQKAPAKVNPPFFPLLFSSPSGKNNGQLSAPRQGVIMLCRSTRFLAAVAILVTSTLPASALNIPKGFDEALNTAAARMMVKDYAGARQAALKSSENGPKAFLLGMSNVHLEQWEEAAANFASAADSYPILGDYALYYHGLSLSKLQRWDEALVPLYRMLKEYPDSRLVRSAVILYADVLASGDYPKEALASYSSFIERYPSGSDSISALYGSALARERLGDPAAAAQILRGIWLNYPASSFADQAAAELKRVAAAGTRVEPYSSAELFKRGSTLYDLGRHKKAAEALAELPLAGESEEFATKVRLKMGQALLKAKQYQEAQAAFRSVLQKEAGGTSGSEARFWLAKALDKSGKGEEAFDLFLKLAESPRGGSVANDALLEAAYFKRYQRKWDEANRLFERYLANFPEQKKSSTVMWEAAWAAYQSRNFPVAAADFRKLAEREEMREKALYWLGKTLSAAGDAKGAEASLSALATEYPFGYYALICDKWCELSQSPTAPGNLVESLPLPAGFAREKALIGLGLYNEAGRELTLVRKKNPLGAARLYLEMGNYNGALHSIANLNKKPGEQSATAWGLNYPQAFREDVAKNAALTGVPENLVYAIMRTESNYLPGAQSPVGAVGLMQIMPATAESISKGDSARLTVPDLNIRLGARHLKDLMELYDQNLTLVIAAYNAGSGNVKRWQKGLGSLPKDEFIESIPFKETREYVKKVVTAMELYQRLYRVPADKNQVPEQRQAVKGAEDKNS